MYTSMVIIDYAQGCLWLCVCVCDGGKIEGSFVVIFYVIYMHVCVNHVYIHDAWCMCNLGIAFLSYFWWVGFFCDIF